jgi:hypothetical protein
MCSFDVTRLWRLLVSYQESSRVYSLVVLALLVCTYSRYRLDALRIEAAPFLRLHSLHSRKLLYSLMLQ